MLKTIDWAGHTIIETFVPESNHWIPELLKEFNLNRHKVQKSHKIGGRWENQYLEIDDVPSVRTPMRFARDLGKEKMSMTSVILFEAPPHSTNPHPPFWFNIAKPQQITGLHDHAHLSKLSAVTYLKAEDDSGDLYFRQEGIADLRIKPEIGKMVIFPPFLKHGVHCNQSSKDRISFAFNLFPFPLIQPEI